MCMLAQSAHSTKWIYLHTKRPFFWNQSSAVLLQHHIYGLKNRCTLTSTHYSKKKPQEEISLKSHHHKCIIWFNQMYKTTHQFSRSVFQIKYYGSVALLFLLARRFVLCISVRHCLRDIFSKKSDKIIHITLYQWRYYKKKKTFRPFKLRYFYSHYFWLFE